MCYLLFKLHTFNGKTIFYYENKMNCEKNESNMNENNEDI